MYPDTVSKQTLQKLLDRPKTCRRPSPLLNNMMNLEEYRRAFGRILPPSRNPPPCRLGAGADPGNVCFLVLILLFGEGNAQGVRAAVCAAAFVVLAAPILVGGHTRRTPHHVAVDAASRAVGQNRAQTLTKNALRGKNCPTPRTDDRRGSESRRTRKYSKASSGLAEWT